ncbi:flagellar M-ring protein FliF [Mesobacillus subterraneus]|uniref:flagellar basal-body MS-ring/collar protein FliF n=1 Tax=Mesobacillus subterraneus TaxID=285983 RepID=UPI00204201DB|nr:flagellar basal-body MS-ring/collar protein FliF [Mesobacillus subterraneus]MCM3665633.1 flagellar M-ring protein FliF [Mesobacillus subterraneus]MCM3684379.1 flagellar M-ring protein FliF [Mesobacillus subterraneus]
MKETVQKYLHTMKDFWQGRTRKQKISLGASIFFVLAIAGLTAFLTSRTSLVPLYSNLSPAETGTIKESLDARGITSEIADGGKTILVPEESVDSLKVELAAEGIPKSGSIDYSFFSQNAGLGMTDNEFNVLKLEAMQTELAELMKGIEGVNDAKVMINLPEKGIFVNDSTEQASASIVLNTSPGYQFKEEQINSLYHLVAKSVPSLPTDNIVIMNQFFEYFDLKNENNSSGATFASQHEIKQQIERDVQRQVQNMLGTLMGHDKVVVSVSADIDFTQENREENLVEPVDKENMEGIAISAQRITETFTGNADQVGGVTETGDPADSNGAQYLEGANGNGDYEKVEETINSEVSRIRKEITESPYKVRDLGIQVMVEPPTPDDPNSLPQERVDDITKILGTIVRTTIDKNSLATELTDEVIEDKVVVSVQPFNGKVTFENNVVEKLPWWVYLVGGLLLAAIVVLLLLFIRTKKTEVGDEFVIEEKYEQIRVPDVNKELETESTMKKKQLEKMAKEKPEDFAKLLRTWISEE